MTPKKITLDIDYNYFLTQQYPDGSSCIKHQLDEQRDLREDDAFPTTVTKNNTEIRQIFFEPSQVNFDIIGYKLNMDVVTISAILQPPGNFIPIHRDTFFQINKRFPDDERTKVRANIFLEDWQPGHLIQYETDKGWKTADNWTQGQGIMWGSGTPHIGANVGLTNKYTLQVSGFLLDYPGNKEDTDFSANIFKNI